MNGSKTKRIVWTMAILIALSFVAAIVLHKHEEPKVIGNLSKEDVAEISKVTVNYEKTYLKCRMRAAWKLRHVGPLLRYIRAYVFIKVFTVESRPNYTVATLGPEAFQPNTVLYLEKADAEWRLTTFSAPPASLPEVVK